MAVDGSVTRPSSSIFWRAVIMLFASLVTCRILVPTEINIPCILEIATSKNPGDVEKTKSENCTPIRIPELWSSSQ